MSFKVNYVLLYMGFNKRIREEKKDLLNVFNRFKRKDFRGSGGEAIKNSTYQLMITLSAKIGSLLFTALIARMLLPELFGLYSLTLATIVLFSTFSDLGLGSAFMTFCANELSKGNKSKAKAYAKKLIAWKINIILISSLVLILLSYFISNYYYDKPIFYALLAGALYLPLSSILPFMEGLFRISNNFRIPMIREIIFQASRLIIAPTIIFILMKTNLSDEIKIMFVILSIVICYIISLLFLTPIIRKKIIFLKVKESSLNGKEIKDLRKFIFPLSFTLLSGIFFGQIDTLMLGRFVSSESLAYYGVAFSLIASASTMVSFTSGGLFPIFAKIKGKSLEKLFNKTRNFTFLISLASSLFIFIFSKIVINIIYGEEYLSAVPLLMTFSILALFLPISALYSNYYISQKRTTLLAKLLIITTIINIVLNYFAINYGLQYGEPQALLGAALATITSKLVHFVGLIILKNRKKKII